MNRRDFVAKGTSTLVVGSRSARVLLLAATAPQQDVEWPLNSDHIRLRLDPAGTLQTLEVKPAGNEWERVEFCRGLYAGPSWANIKLERDDGLPANFSATAEGLRYSLRYELKGNRLAILAGLKNERTVKYAPKTASLVLGIDCEMLSYPAWNHPQRALPVVLVCLPQDHPSNAELTWQQAGPAVSGDRTVDAAGIR